ncbi:hypothetical protein [Paenibacillus sp. CF384]|uniref:hypothetical protein n=1 Tax=Paenibacillus sp. CF384 TaxID=1884382 RepID=UPI000896C229|nr:hypothetical protein [Paenibacillus sp. CF384]SDW61052.1 hypothetical protein SAMN05518855_1003302 [Paenibacillus sp. CF384]
MSFKVLTYTYRGGAHGETVAATYNVRNAAKASPVKLKDLFGSNYKSIVNFAVKAEIATRPDEFDAFKSISDNQAFLARLRLPKAVPCTSRWPISPKFCTPIYHS